MAANNFSGAIKEMLIGNNEFMEAGIEMYKLFSAYTQAGFTEDQAIKLLIGIVSEGATKGRDTENYSK